MFGALSLQTFSCNSDENVMELDGCDSASSSSLDFPWEASMDTPSVDQNANGCKGKKKLSLIYTHTHKMRYILVIIYWNKFNRHSGVCRKSFD